LGKFFGPGQGVYDSEKTMVLGKVTLSEPRHQMSKVIFDRYPETQVGGPSYRWFLTAFQAGYEILEKARQWSPPVLLLQAGQDSVVSPEAQNEFCQQASHCKLQIFPESRHEILMERDEIRNEALSKIKSFYLGNGI
jgi:lysophospholipase